MRTLNKQQKVTGDPDTGKSNSKLVYSTETPKVENKKQKRIRKRKEKPRTLQQRILAKARNAFRNCIVTQTCTSSEMILTVSVRLHQYDETLYVLTYKHDGKRTIGVKMQDLFYKRYGRVHGTHRSLIDLLNETEFYDGTV